MLQALLIGQSSCCWFLLAHCSTKVIFLACCRQQGQPTSCQSRVHMHTCCCCQRLALCDDKAASCSCFRSAQEQRGAQKLTSYAYMLQVSVRQLPCNVCNSIPSCSCCRQQGQLRSNGACKSSSHTLICWRSCSCCTCSPYWKHS